MADHIDFEEHTRGPQDYASCPFCKVVFSHTELMQHVKDGCPKELVGCPFCLCEFPRSLLQEHQRTCDMRPANCEYCGASFKTYYQLRAEHYSSCPHRPAPCAYHVFGCKFEGTQIQLREHDMRNMHAELLHRKLENTESELKTYKKRAVAENRRLTEMIEQLTAKNLALEASNEELRKQVQGQAVALQDVNNKLEKLVRDHETQANSLQKTREEIAQWQGVIGRMILEKDLTTRDPTYTWKIQPYRHLKQIITQLNKTLHTDVISTGSPGYRFQFSCGLAGHSLSVYMMILRGEDDDLLPWPFANRIIVRLKSQKNSQDDVEKVVHPAKCVAACFQKPEDSGHNPRFGFNEFIRMPVLENETKGYLAQDCIVLQFIVVPLQ